jgi:hypothetical protein
LESGVAKKKSQSSRGASAPARSASAKGSSAALIVAIGLAGAGGYALGKKGDVVEQNVAALFGSEKSASAAKPAAESKNGEAARPVKTADKAELARLLKGGGARTAESRTGDARAAEPKPPADIPTPPAKPELARAETDAEPAKPESARGEAARPETAKANAPPQPAPLAFALLDREITQSAEDGERVTLSLNFENIAGKPIRAFEGVVKLTDHQDNGIFSSKISVSALIAEGGALHWDQHVDARKLDEKGKRLLSEDKANLKAVFLLRKIFFVDGSVQKYAMPPRAAQAG